MGIENIVEVKNLSKKYGRFEALSGITLSLPKGKIIGLIGPNGAGKTTFLKILSGLMLGSSGSITIDGIDLASCPGLAQKKVAFMLENNPLPDHLRVGEYLRFRAKLKGVKDVRRRVESVMRKCDLYYDARYKMIKTLSKGYRQRVGIADALLGDQPLVVLDEPTIGLDPRQIVAIRKTIRELCASKTLVISSHILSELESICDYYVMINKGQIVANGTLDDITKEDKSDEFYAEIADNYPRTELNQFLLDHHLNYVLLLNNNKNINCVKFKLVKDYQKIMRAFIDHFGDKLISFGRERSSLEGAFLRATKRSRDDD
ncbi:MAG: ABC transporter ATP-binding protein [Opitutales bacterium]|nr:ABC transporter ATP-binding protein [Opitutales bacterium]